MAKSTNVTSIYNGEFIISSKIAETDFSYIYKGYEASTNSPCIIKQYKFDLEMSPEINREIKIFNTIKDECLPTPIRPIRKENDGYFAVFSPVTNGSFVNNILESTSALNMIEVRNILIQMFNTLKILSLKNIAITNFSIRTIIYSPTQPQTVFIDITNNVALQPNHDENIRKEMDAVRRFIEIVVPWVKEKDLDGFWLNKSDSELLEFYKVLCNDPLNSPNCNFVQGELKTVSLVEGIDEIANEYLGF